MKDDEDGIEWFVKRGADVNGYNRNGWTPLIAAGYMNKRAVLKKQVLRSRQGTQKLELEMWDRAQCEAARLRKSDGDW